MSAAERGGGRRVAVVGGGWAGCAAAVSLLDAGCDVTVVEAARTLGGRARAIETNGRLLDNGQHIMLGAYAGTLKLMRRVGVDPDKALLRLPLQMRYPVSAPDDGMDFVAPRLPAPLHVLVALLRARGLDLADKMALARFSTTARWMGWQLHNDCSVAELLERFDQTERLIRLMWRPLCLAALNTAPEHASAQVFLAVLRDSLGAHRAASDMLIPRVLLDAVFPEAARRHLESRGATVRTGSRIDGVDLDGGIWRLRAGADVHTADAIVLATPPWQTAALLRPLDAAAPTVAQLDAFAYEPIATVYLQYAGDVRLPLPFCALADAPDAGRWGQFVFDRGQLDAGQAGLLAVVISGADAAATVGQDALAQAVAAQLAAAFGLPALANPQWARTITEKRATFACTPGLKRPANDVGLPGLAVAGDYTAGDYPATLESAVRSGVAAAGIVAGAGAGVQ